jgi:O-antigen chain-terminating methyltransferase
LSNIVHASQNITDDVLPNLQQLVVALPEIYQPIFGHPELSHAAARTCEDRLEHIFHVNDLLSQQLGRPLRILDLGCAQGYIALSLAARGAAVVGIDLIPANIAVCNALAQEHPEYAIGFEVAAIESVLLNADLSKYDLIIGLSVFHHLNHTYGHRQVTQLISQAGQKAPAWIFELALPTEPLEWAASQPTDLGSMLSAFAFVRELARIPNHLSDIQRPLIYASNAFWYVDNSLEYFTSWSNQSHKYVGGFFQDTRRYYYNERSMLKFFSTEGLYGQINQTEIDSESAFLRTEPPLLNPCPALRTSGSSATRTWLIRDLFEGELLSHSIEIGTPLEHDRIIRDILLQLVQLETHGLYHTDLRTWNVLMLRSGGATVIDYGAIGPIGEDCAWPNNLILGFWTFVSTVCGVTKNPGVPNVAPFISPVNLPERYRAWGFSVWNTPPETWSFRLLLDELDRIGLVQPSTRQYSAQEIWMHEIENYLHQLNDYTRSMTSALQDTHKTQMQHTQLIKHLMKAVENTEAHS